MPHKTHTLVNTPTVNIRYLADYMAASEQTKRTILRSCKYRPTARMIQHIEAKLAVTNYIKSGSSNPEELRDKAAQILNKLTVDEFEESTNLHNANYLKRFAEVSDLLNLPKAELSHAGKAVTIPVNGVNVRFDPALTATRTTRTNKLKCGALMLRYQKAKPLPEATGRFQSAGALGLLRLQHEGDSVEPDATLCITVDGYTGEAHPAPTNSAYLFKEMQAACASISERWQAIPPPKGAIF